MALPARNLLSSSSSPYLRQHAGNPVHWRPWSAEALAEARERDCPILVSIGYAACHWCHVMAHESFEDPSIAAEMNRLFVNIKIDREERPEIDQIYMAALAAMGEQGGWPLTMFLTPDGEPFWGGTYFAPVARYGRPGFSEILHAIDSAWKNNKTEIARNAATLRAHVGGNLARTAPPAALDPKMLGRLAQGILKLIDMEKGGLSGAPKFPNAPLMATLWLEWLHGRATVYRDAFIHSLAAMLRGGVYDHVGGGLCRYSTDADWTIPHFEKMLYDNGLLLRQANWAFAETQNMLFRARIESTVAWLLREMRTESGSFASSLDADSEGEEGLFYSWTREQVETVLGAEDTERLLHTYELASSQEWHGHPIIRRNNTGSDGEEIALHPLLDRLLTARGNRVRPGRDDKVLTDWNGLAITGLAEAARTLSRPDWLAAARQAFAAVSGTADGNGRLPHSTLGQDRLYPALSSDYAAMINAAVTLWEATSDEIFLEAGRRFADLLDRWHGDEKGGGHHLTASDAADVPLRIRGDVDEAIPSATGQIIEAFTRLAAATGDQRLSGRTIEIAEAASGRAAGQAYGQAGIINATALLLDSRRLLLVENPENPHFVTIANRNPDPRRVDVLIPLGDTPQRLPDGTEIATDRPAAYLCRGQTCDLPIFDAATLEAALRSA